MSKPPDRGKPNAARRASNLFVQTLAKALPHDRAVDANSIGADSNLPSPALAERPAEDERAKLRQTTALQKDLLRANLDPAGPACAFGPGDETRARGQQQLPGQIDVDPDFGGVDRTEIS